jgi:hypothetical protein
MQPATLDAKGVWHVTQDIVLVKANSADEKPR